MLSEIETELGQREARRRREYAQPAGRGKRRQQREGGQPVQRRRRVEAFERQHGEAERAIARFADHVAVPVLRLQEAGEPAPPLPEKGRDRGRRVGVGEGPAENPHFRGLAARQRA